MGARFGAVLWLIAGGLVYLTYTSAQVGKGGELIFAPLAFIAVLVAFVVGGVPWKL